MSDNTERQSQLMREVEMIGQSASQSTASAHTERELQLLHDVSVMPTVQAVGATTVVATEQAVVAPEPAVETDEVTKAERAVAADRKAQKVRARSYVEKDSGKALTWGAVSIEREKSLKLGERKTLPKMIKHILLTCILHDLDNTEALAELTHVDIDLDASAVADRIIQLGSNVECGGLFGLFVMLLDGAKTVTTMPGWSKTNIHNLMTVTITKLIDDTMGYNSTDLGYTETAFKIITEDNFGVNTLNIRQKYKAVKRWENSKTGEVDIQLPELLDIMDARTPDRNTIDRQIAERKKAEHPDDDDGLKLVACILEDDTKGGFEYQPLWESKMLKVGSHYTGTQPDGSHLLKASYDEITERFSPPELVRAKAVFSQTDCYTIEQASIDLDDSVDIKMYLQRMKNTRQTVEIAKPVKCFRGFTKKKDGSFERCDPVEQKVKYDYEDPNTRQNLVLIVSPQEKYMRVGDTVFVVDRYTSVSDSGSSGMESASSDSWDGSAGGSDSLAETSPEVSDEEDAELDRERFRLPDKQGHQHRSGAVAGKKGHTRSQGKPEAQCGKRKASSEGAGNGGVAKRSNVSSKDGKSKASPEGAGSGGFTEQSTPWPEGAGSGGFTKRSKTSPEGPGGGGVTKRKKVLSDDEC